MARARLQHTTSEISERFTRIIVFANSASTNARRSLALIGDLEKFAPHATFLTVAISSDPQEAGLQDIKQLLGPKTLLCIAAGDGTINAIASQLLLDPTLSGQARLTCILPLWGGNANDLACMLNGSPPVSLTEVLNKASVEPISVVQMKTNDMTKLSLSSLTFGATAHIARALNNDTYRKTIPKNRLGRYQRELQAVTLTTAKSPQLLILEDGDLASISEYMVINGRRMAKHFTTPVDLADSDFYVQIFRKRRHMLATAFKAFVTRRPMVRGTRRSHVSFITHSAVLCQIDGESFPIQSKTTIDISIHPKPLRVLTSKVKSSI